MTAGDATTPYVLVSGDFVLTGGMDRANHALADYLARQGHPVHLVTHRADPELAARPTVVVHRVPKPGGSYLLGEPLLDRQGRAWAARLGAAGGRTLANGGNCLAFDLNWVHYVHQAYAPAAGGGTVRRAVAGLVSRRARRRERRAVRGARLVFANSRRTAADLVERVGVAPDVIRTIYYGIDAEQFRPPTEAERGRAVAGLGWTDERRRAVFIGGLGDRRKGFDLLFDAWRSVCGVTADWDLVVVGSGRDLSAWRGRAAEAGLGERVTFLGFRRDVPQILAASDLLVAPTRYEAYGLGVHEALCAGLPAVVTADAGVAERYPPALDDLLVPAGSAAGEWAARVGSAIDRIDRHRHAVTALSATLRQRTWDVMAAELVAAVPG